MWVKIDQWRTANFELMQYTNLADIMDTDAYYLLKREMKHSGKYAWYKCSVSGSYVLEFGGREQVKLEEAYKNYLDYILLGETEKILLS